MIRGPVSGNFRTLNHLLRSWKFSITNGPSTSEVIEAYSGIALYGPAGF
jgi:hypothetical protein